VLVLGGPSLLMCTNGRRQGQTERGRLVSLNLDGVMVGEVRRTQFLTRIARADAFVDFE
jgi:hypothetical protein